MSVYLDAVWFQFSALEGMLARVRSYICYE